MVSDQAKNVGGQVVHDLCECLGIQKRHNSPYHPEGNGQAERSFQTIKTLVHCVMVDEELPRYAWPSILQKATFMNNASVNTSMQYTPHELMYGSPPQLPSVKSSPPVAPAEELPLADHVEETQAVMEEKWATAASNLTAAKAACKKQYEKRGATQARNFCVGDYVYLRSHARTSGLDPFYHGPYEVLAVHELTVTVCSERRGELTVHKNHVRPAKQLVW